MVYDLKELAVNLADGRLSVDALKAPRTPRRLQLHAAIVVLIFNGRYRFPVGDQEGSYQHSLLSLFPNSRVKQLMEWSVHDGMHRHDQCRNSHIELTPPQEFWNFVNLFDTVPPVLKRLFTESGISPKNPHLIDIKPQGFHATHEAVDPVRLMRSVLDEEPKRSTLLAASGQIKASYYATITTCLVWSCRNTFLDKRYRASSSLNQIYKGLLGSAFTAHHGNSIRDASRRLGFHSCSGRVPTFHPPEDAVRVMDEHPKTTAFVTHFIADARTDIEKAKLRFMNMLPEVTNHERAKNLASIIQQYEPSVIVEALRMIRSNS